MMKNTRQERQADTRKAILQTALELIAEKGLDKLSLREIARRVGYSPAGLYEYFDSKEGILLTLAEEGDGWLDTDYETVDIGTERYEKIPVLIYEENGEENTGYSLRKLPKEHEGGALGVSLMILGGGAIIACHLYDWIHGIHTIETKRDRVRFKYGKQLSFSMDPMIDLDRQFAGVSLGVKF